MFLNKYGFVHEDQDSKNRLQKKSHIAREECKRKLRKKRNIGRQMKGLGCC